MKTPAFWYRPAGPVAALLAPLGALYGAAVRRRLAGTAPRRAAVPVLCVGNLVAGGAGKTPVAIAVAEALRARGVTPAFLTRGHGGRLPGPVAVDLLRHTARDVGDEPLVLAAHAATWVARDRAAGAAAAASDGAAAVVMDDGFQNPALVKDLALVVADGAVGFGNGHLIPAGPLREPVSGGLGRADALVVLGEDRAGVAALAAAAAPGLPVLHARLEPAGEAGVLAGRRVLAFAGIGRPEKFFATVRALGAVVVETVPFADHHPYDPDEIMRLVEHATSLGAEPVTTAKDAARLSEAARAMVRVVPVRAVFAEPDRLAELLDRLVPAVATGGAGGPAA